MALLESKWELSKKVVISSYINFHFVKDENKILKPLHNAHKRGDSGSDWKKAYQAVKHDRANNLEKANLKHLIRAMAALFILNLGTNLQMGFFPYVVYNFLKLLIGSPRNHF